MNRDHQPPNPILTRDDIPDVSPRVSDVTSVFNPGAIKLGDRSILLLRVQTRGRETVFMLAESGDGEAFTVQPRLLEVEGMADIADLDIYHIYDPRLTQIDDTIYIIFAVDTSIGCRLGEVGRSGAIAVLEALAPAHRVDEVVGGVAPGCGLLDRGDVEDVSLDHLDPVPPRLQ